MSYWREFEWDFYSHSGWPSSQEDRPEHSEDCVREQSTELVSGVSILQEHVDGQLFAILENFFIE